MQLDLFTGEVNENIAHVYARLPRTHTNQKITGRIRGPFNQFAQTLPANASFRDLGPGDTVLARAVVTDPCTWSPDSPALYQVKIETDVQSKQILNVVYGSELFGIRRFSAQGQDLSLDGKRWVVRGIANLEQACEFTEWREHAAVRVMSGFDNRWAANAAKSGVAVIVELDHAQAEELQFIANFPCVMIVIMSEPPPENVKTLVPNLLLAQRVPPEQTPAVWADVAWVAINKEFPSTDLLHWNIPVVIERSGHYSSISEARTACDQLQADLAPLGQFAGYVV